MSPEEIKAPASTPACVPFRRPKLKRKTNLSLLPAVVAEASRIASERYHTSLSGMAEKLFKLEIERDAKRKSKVKCYRKRALHLAAKAARHGPRATAA